MIIFPFKPGDWVSDDVDQVARVKSVWEGEPGEVLLDLIMFNHAGDQLGRVSPVMGGPRTFEPACSSESWKRIKEPSFPIRMVWLPDGKGRKVARFWAGDRLPPASWTPRKRRLGRGAAAIADDRFRKAVEQIAAGHNDARQLAKDTLGRSR